MITAALHQHNSAPVVTVVATSPSRINHPPPFFQHFQLEDLQGTLRISFVFETVITLNNGFKQHNDDGTPTTIVDKTRAVATGTLWRTGRALATGTTLRSLEQVLILIAGAKFVSDIFLEDAADVSRDTETLRTKSSEVVARVESSMSAFSSGVRSTALYHISVALVGMTEYYLVNYLEKTKVEQCDRNTWFCYLWEMCGWSTFSTGLGAALGTIVAPGVGSALGRLVGMNAVYILYPIPNQVNKLKE
jgi:hypothetical protein|tara:strand:+ start:38 stop:781 length:744 start_codon:yes stop_codon:yes gene_type:complete